MVLSSEIEGNWDIVITSLQDICNSNESLTFDNIYKKHLEELTHDEDELTKLKEEIIDHKSNIGTARRLIDTSHEKLQTLIEYLQKQLENEDGDGESEAAISSTKESSVAANGKEGVSTRKGAAAAAAAAASSTRRSSTPSSAVNSAASKSSGSGTTPAANTSDSRINKDTKKGSSKKGVGRSFYTSKFNPSEPIYVGSEVAYKLKNRHFEEWIQCEVMKVIGDGIKFEIRDPEPDENNNPGQTFKANYKEILLIPPLEEVKELSNYPYGTKVLARYPETTTFYPAVVVGNRKDGSVRLKFDGEEEVNKETEVERRLVVPFPEK
ncbi:SGF29 tudor-like domain-containing protein [Scheffersomyces amazonensis]|uniref:SGF29 tudor-like domain-containing protein n=1 Tax=Scheffersomyces amazonensis TaxID=1078765 RepID=UPI00315DD510